MFRRRTFSSGNIHYRINIDKSMCPNPVDIYIDGDTYQHSFNGSYPEEIINFTYMPEFYNQITSNNRITWQGHLITSDHCITANACEGCQSVAVGTGIYNNTYNVNIVIVVPS